MSRRRMMLTAEAKCLQCGRAYHPGRDGGRFCSATCRERGTLEAQASRPAHASIAAMSPDERAWAIRAGFVRQVAP